MGDSGGRLELTDQALAYRCYELNEVAETVKLSLVKDLEQIKTDLRVYSFTERLKGVQNIHNKVLRKRDELRARATDGANARSFNPEEVTDSWGCRFVTLFQSQIPDVMARIFRQIERWRATGNIVLIDSIEIYTNRPPGDPLSIARSAAQLTKNFSHVYFVSGSNATEIKQRFDSRESGYSAIHFVMAATIKRVIERREQEDTVRFEIQIRDIFEEAWSQVSHAVSYSDKDRLYDTGAVGNPTVDIIARPQLNALKTVADGCGQLAEQIRRTYDDLRGRLSIIDAKKSYTSVVPLAQVRDLVLGPIGLDREVLRSMVTQAYAHMQTAQDAADRNYDNRVARDFYLAAAVKFDECLGRVGDALAVGLSDGKTIEWYLKIERANALIFSLPSKMRDADDRQRRDYDQACRLYDELEARYPDDHVVQLRRAQAQRKSTRTVDEALGTIRRLEDSLVRLGDSRSRLKGESDMTRQMVLIELGLARLELSDLSDVGSVKIAALRAAICEVQSVCPNGKIREGQDSESLRVYHRALSNVVWFYHKLKTSTDAIVSNEDLAILRENIDALRGPEIWPVARFYTETIENIMCGYAIIGEAHHGCEMANLNLGLLKEIGRDQRKPGDKRDDYELLDSEQKDMWARAILFVQKHAMLLDQTTLQVPGSSG